MIRSKFTNLIDLDDLPDAFTSEVIESGAAIAENAEKYADACRGKIMATLFYEPSTRTQMSFQTAMLRLGGTIIGFDNPETSSVAKGENLKDTTKVVSSYADILVMRNPVEGSAKAAALTADCPVINAGDGGHLHPTQTLTDLLTIKIEKKRVDHLTIGICGDLRFGRTTHSLCKAMSKYPGNRFVFITAPSLAMPDYIKQIITANGCTYTEISSLEAAMPELDMLYMTRILKERFAERFADENVAAEGFILTEKLMKRAKADCIVMHPLPRVDEIEIAVDSDPRAVYFKQAKYGVFVRMALILEVFKNKYPTALLSDLHSDHTCGNVKCVTNREHYLPKSFREENGKLVCEYCESV
jgi:aspartate carbamoyltransferase catalytic subunit